MARCDRANPDSRNFGLGSRDMGYAGRSALREGMQSHSSIATMADRWGQFASWGCKPEPPKFPSTPLTPCHKGI